jgi:hypothetical protein
VERNLAGQVGKIQRQVRGAPAKSTKPARRAKRRPATGKARRGIAPKRSA